MANDFGEKDLRNLTHLEDEGDDPYERLIDKVTYICLVDGIAFLGLVGNIFMLMLMQTKTNKSHSYAVHISILVVTDSIVLLHTVFEDTMDEYVMPLDNLYASYVAVCKVVPFLASLVTWFSSWLVVCITVDRFIVIFYPFRRHKFCTRKLAFILDLVVLCTLVAFHIPILIYYYVTESDEGTICTASELTAYTMYTIAVTMTLFTTIPIGVTFIMNILIIRKVSRSIRFRRKYSSENSAPQTSRKVTVSLIAVSMMEVVCMAPIVIAECVEIVCLYILDPNKHYGTINMIDSVWPLLNLIKMLKFAHTFYIFIIAAKQNRLAFKNMFIRRESRRRTSATETQTITVTWVGYVQEIVTIFTSNSIRTTGISTRRGKYVNIVCVIFIILCCL